MSRILRLDQRHAGRIRSRDFTGHTTRLRVRWCPHWDYRVQIGLRLMLAELRHFPVAHHISVALISSAGAVQDDHLGNLPRQDVLIG